MGTRPYSARTLANMSRISEAINGKGYYLDLMVHLGLTILEYQAKYPKMTDFQVKKAVRTLHNCLKGRMPE